MRKVMAVWGLCWGSCEVRGGASSMRLNALRVPSPSQTAIHIGLPISLALASAAAIIRWAASTVMLNFWKVFAAIEIPLSLVENDAFLASSEMHQLQLSHKNRQSGKSSRWTWYV